EAIALDAHRCRVKELHSGVFRFSIHVVSTEELAPAGAGMFVAHPSPDPPPQVVPDVVVSGRRAAVPEILGPSPDHPVEPVNQDTRGLVGVMTCGHGLDPTTNRLHRFLRRVAIDI